MLDIFYVTMCFKGCIASISTFKIGSENFTPIVASMFQYFSNETVNKKESKILCPIQTIPGLHNFKRGHSGFANSHNVKKKMKRTPNFSLRE
jgi:hypothetical protein